MTKLSKRKTKLQFTTDATIFYRGRYRSIVIEVNNGLSASVRLLGSRQRYEFSWEGLHDWAARLHAERERETRKKPTGSGR